MRHTSVRLNTPCEFINITPLNPLISKCQIKVCYVSDEPNRNKSVINKETATKMANSLPGSPIVGFYNEVTGDFEEHNRVITLANGEFNIKDSTKPYGFVDVNAKCWFQKFLDDGQVEREYLMTEGYLWTGQYPEAQRIIDKGNNQSMELDEKTLNASWTKDSNGMPQFFIINEAIISKLCILGEDCEPCFEGASVTKVEFSLGDDFKQELFSMMNQLKEILNEGGERPMENKEETIVVEETQITEDDTSIEFKKNPDQEEEDSADKGKDDKSDNDNSDNNSEDENSSDKDEEDSDEEDEKKKKYNLDEIPEYTELASRYSALETEYNDLKAEKANLEAQITELTNFKVNAERVQKKNMIDNTFYMLSDEDKKDVVENIDTYSLDEIEAKLSILCVRNKVSFAALEDDDTNGNGPTTYTIDSDDTDNSIPAWIKAVLDTEKTLN